MSKKSSSILVAILIVLLASVSFNIYLFKKNDELEKKVNTFIPAAISLEDENKRLQENEKRHQEMIDNLTYTKDSILQTLGKQSPQAQPSTLPGTPDPQTALPQQPAPETQSGQSFKDLNKGIQ